MHRLGGFPMVATRNLTEHWIYCDKCSKCPFVWINKLRAIRLKALLLLLHCSRFIFPLPPNTISTLAHCIISHNKVIFVLPNDNLSIFLWYPQERLLHNLTLTHQSTALRSNRERKTCLNLKLKKKASLIS